MRYWFVRSPFKTRTWGDVLVAGVFNLYCIRSYATRKNISEMKKNDEALWYSSSSGKKVFGSMKVKEEAFQDRTSKKNWLAIDFIPIKTFKKAVTYSELIENNILNKSNIIKQKRITVVEISKKELEEVFSIVDMER